MNQLKYSPQPIVENDDVQVLRQIWETSHLQKLEHPPPHTKPNPRSKICGGLCCRHNCVVLWCTLGILMFLGGLGTAIGMGVKWVHPYLQSLDYKRGECEAVSATYIEKAIKCSCGRYCSSSFPCVVITVKIKDTGMSAVLYKSDHHMAAYSQCSTSSCSKFGNGLMISMFESQYGSPGNSYECLYEPSGGVALLERSHKTSWAIHVILWPTLSAVLGAIIILVVCCFCCGHTEM